MRTYLETWIVLTGIGALLVCSPAFAASSGIQKPPEPIQRPLNPLAPTPDLRIEDVWLERDGKRVAENLEAGQRYLFICKFSNAGTALAGSWKVGHYIDGRLMHTQQLGNVPAGYSGTISWPFTPDSNATGAHRYRCLLDTESSTRDRKRDDNRMDLAFHVVQPGGRPGIPQAGSGAGAFGKAERPRVYTFEEVTRKNMTLADLKDSDVIESKGKRVTVAEWKRSAVSARDQAAKRARERFNQQVSHTLAQSRTTEASNRTALARTAQQGFGSRLDSPARSGLPCDVPRISSVYPAVVNPGDPVLISGCGFLAQPGQAVISVPGDTRIERSGIRLPGELFTQDYAVMIRSWTDTRVEATIPTEIGLSGPKDITVTVKTSQGTQGTSERFSLTPFLDYQVLRAPQEELDGYCGECSFEGGGANNGTHLHFQHTALNNNWRVERFEFSCSYFELTSTDVPGLGTIPGGFSQGGCSWPAYGAAVIGGTEPHPGDAQITGISIEWRRKTPASPFDGVLYFGAIIVKGPKGTSP